MLPFRHPGPAVAGAAAAATALVMLTTVPVSAYSRPKACDSAYSYLPVESPKVNGVNLRRGPGTANSSLGHLSKGDRVTAYCFADVPGPADWDYVRLDRTSKTGIKAGTWGWAQESYLTVVGHRR